MSQYAIGPSASTRAGSPFVFPAQRPASPEIAESPSVTTAGVPTPGPSAAAGPQSPSASAIATTTNLPASRIARSPRRRSFLARDTTPRSSALQRSVEREHDQQSRRGTIGTHVAARSMRDARDGPS